MCVGSLSYNLLVGHNLPFYGAIIFVLVAVIIAAIMMRATSSDGAGITLNNDGEKTPHVSLTSPSFSEFE